MKADSVHGSTGTQMRLNPEIFLFKDLTDLVNSSAEKPKLWRWILKTAIHFSREFVLERRKR